MEGTAARAIAMLPLITGSWQTPRRGVCSCQPPAVFPFNNARLQMPELIAAKPPRTALPASVNMSQLGNGAQ